VEKSSEYFRSPLSITLGTLLRVSARRRRLRRGSRRRLV